MLKVSCPWVSEAKLQNQSQHQQGSLFFLHPYLAALKHLSWRRQSSHWTWVLTKVHRPIPKYKIPENREKAPSFPLQVCKAAAFCQVTPHVTRHSSLSSHDYTKNRGRTNCIQTSRGDSSGWSPWVNYRQDCNHVCPRYVLWLGKNKEFQSLTWTCPGYKNCCPVWMSPSLLDPQEQSIPKWVKEE